MGSQAPRADSFLAIHPGRILRSSHLGVRELAPAFESGSKLPHSKGRLRGILPVPTETPRLLAIFDHDGVLVDSLELHQQAWVELGERAGLPVTAAFIHETFGM